MNIWIYPGSFDPITNGHLDVIHRSAKLCDKLYVSVLSNSVKKCLFSVEERKELIRKSCIGLDNLCIDTFEGLLVDYVHSKKAKVIIRGLRAVSDFEHEFQMAALNRQIGNDIETVFMMAGSEHFYVSSTMVKEIGRLGGDISYLVDKSVKDDILKKLITKQV